MDALQAIDGFNVYGLRERRYLPHAAGTSRS
jgi:hypothetical protein